MSAVIVNPPRVEPTYFVRSHDWQQRLEAYLVQASAMPFAWGRHDCALFVAGAIEAMTGVDIAADFRGRYASRLGALRQVWCYRVAGLDELVGLVARRYHINEVPPALAQLGDMVIFDQAMGPTLGLVGGESRIAAMSALGGMVWISLATARRAWAVGRVG